ncbi:MAG: 2,3-bisphosphoglycerate-independent phosphoglycerate mutase [Candidatus Paceibacterota bacterium]
MIQFRTEKICLVILDGWGIGQKNFSNPIYVAQLKFLEEVKRWYPMTALQASGASVGLPFNKAGNSEVGHLTIGTGQIYYQHAVRISQAIQNKSFFQNPVLLKIYNFVKNNQSALHLIGLLSDNVVHSSYDHLIALIDLAKYFNLNKVYLHLLTDGRDSSPYKAKELIEKLKNDLKLRGRGEIASLCGRFYGMDRDQNYKRIEKYYNLLVFGEGNVSSDPLEYLEKSYQQGITDEFILPCLIKDPQDQNLKIIQENDGVIFFNFREERMRELLEPFFMENFSHFPIKKFQNLKIVTFTKYRKDFPFEVAFPPHEINVCLSKTLSENGKRQIHIAETEKFAHVSYFFNGLKEKPYPGEYWVAIPSIKTLHLDEYPALRAPEITQRTLQAIEENIYDFILVNYANGDLIGHTGNFEAGVKCAKIIDEEVFKLVTNGLKENFTFIITSDHGNLEQMKNPFTGEVDTEHNNNLVPFYLIDNRLKLSKPREEREINYLEKVAGGMLSDVAPTILSMFNLNIPKEMTGQSLLPILNNY